MGMQQLAWNPWCSGRRGWGCRGGGGRGGARAGGGRGMMEIIEMMWCDFEDY